MGAMMNITRTEDANQIAIQWNSRLLGWKEGFFGSKDLTHDRRKAVFFHNVGGIWVALEDTTIDKPTVVRIDFVLSVEMMRLPDFSPDDTRIRESGKCLTFPDFLIPNIRNTDKAYVLFFLTRDGRRLIFDVNHAGYDFNLRLLTQLKQSLDELREARKGIDPEPDPVVLETLQAYRAALDLVE